MKIHCSARFSGAWHPVRSRRSHPVVCASEKQLQRTETNAEQRLARAAHVVEAFEHASTLVAVSAHFYHGLQHLYAKQLLRLQQSEQQKNMKSREVSNKTGKALETVSTFQQPLARASERISFHTIFLTLPLLLAYMLNRFKQTLNLRRWVQLLRLELTHGSLASSPREL